MSQGFVRKRGSTWTYYFEDDPDPSTGRRVQRSKGGFATKKDAQAALAEVTSELNKGRFVEPHRIRVGEFLTDRWLPSIKETVRFSTYDHYRRNAEIHVAPRIGGIQLANLTPVRINAFYTDLLASGRRDGKGGLSPKSVRNIHVMLRKALADAHRWELVARNPVEQANPPANVRSAAREEFRTWTAPELRQFLDSMRGKKHFAAMYLAATTGMRRGEVLGLRWRDVHFREGTISITQTLLSVAYELRFSKPKTQRSRRSIAVDRATMEVLAAHRERAVAEAEFEGAGEGDALVFSKPDGSPFHPDWFRQVFERQVARSDLPRIRFHDLRHTHATLALRAGVHPKIVSERLGHSSVALTLDIYSHAAPDIQAEAADTVARLIFGPYRKDEGPEQDPQTDGDDEEGCEE